MDWQSMDTFPRDGTDCDVMVRLKPEYRHNSDKSDEAQIPILVDKIKWARQPMGEGFVYMGEVNILSPALEPYAWVRHRDT